MRRVAIAVWIAVVEGLLLIVHAIPRLLTLAIAVLIVVVFFWLGHRLRPGPLKASRGSPPSRRPS